MCTNPKRIWLYGPNGEDKLVVRFKPDAAIYDADLKKILPLYQTLYIPCGRCEECALSYAKAWAERVLAAVKGKPSTYFVTLTYSDDNLEMLNKKTVERFLNSIFQKCKRKGLPQPQFFLCGEYGGHSLRAHYHMIISGLPFKCVAIKHSKEGNVYDCPELKRLWPHGGVMINTANRATVSYVCRYCMKKIVGRSDAQDKLLKSMGVQTEFHKQSRSLAKDFYLDYVSRDFKNCRPGYFMEGRFIPMDRYAHYLKAKDVDPSDTRTFKAQLRDLMRYSWTSSVTWKEDNARRARQLHEKLMLLRRVKI